MKQWCMRVLRMKSFTVQNWAKYLKVFCFLFFFFAACIVRFIRTNDIFCERGEYDGWKYEAFIYDMILMGNSRQKTFLLPYCNWNFTIHYLLQCCWTREIKRMKKKKVEKLGYCQTVLLDESLDKQTNIPIDIVKHGGSKQLI